MSINIMLRELTSKTDRVLSALRTEIEKGSIVVKGIISDSTVVKSASGISVFSSDKLKEMFFDYLIDCSEESEKQRASMTEKIIPAEVITENVLFDLQKYIVVLEKNISIVSDCAWGKIVCDSLFLSSKSLLEGISISPKDYLKFVKDLPQYMSFELRYKGKVGWTERIVCTLYDIELVFTGIVSFEKAKEYWKKRCLEFNYENYIVVMSKFDNVNQIAQFVSLEKPENKVCFYNESVEHAISFLEWKNNARRKQYRWFSIYLDRTAYRNFIGIKEYSILDMLLGNDCFRGVE